MAQPTLRTARLCLRPFTAADAPAIQRLAGDRAIAATTLNIPHPYDDGLAEEWVEQITQAFVDGQAAVFAVTDGESGELVGAVGLQINQQMVRAELGYWIGKPYWGCGYATEAADAVVGYGFETLALHRIHACYMTRNPASGRVMRKIGMRLEGTLRDHVRKWDEFTDLDFYGILRDEYRAQQDG